MHIWSRYAQLNNSLLVLSCVKCVKHPVPEYFGNAHLRMQRQLYKLLSRQRSGILR